MKKKVEEMTDEELRTAYDREVMEYQLKQVRRAKKYKKYRLFVWVIFLILASPIIFILLAIMFPPLAGFLR